VPGETFLAQGFRGAQSGQGGADNNDAAGALKRRDQVGYYFFC
jgi:hypothetical protein